jgi:parvulin-like peptidyl-prolyl isomerase
MYYPPDLDQMKKIKDLAASGSDFGQLARDNSEGPKAGKGGEIGWVANGQLDGRLTAAIAAVPIGGVTDVVEVSGSGVYLFKVLEQRTAAPDADQLATIKQSCFSNWYTAKKAAVKVTRDLLGT